MLVATGIPKQIGEDHVAHMENSKIYCNFHPSGMVFQIILDIEFSLFVQRLIEL
jgi:hypothetical protein